MASNTQAMLLSFEQRLVATEQKLAEAIRVYDLNAQQLRLTAIATQILMKKANISSEELKEAFIEAVKQAAPGQSDVAAGVNAQPDSGQPKPVLPDGAGSGNDSDGAKPSYSSTDGADVESSDSPADNSTNPSGS